MTEKAEIATTSVDEMTEKAEMKSGLKGPEDETRGFGICSSVVNEIDGVHGNRWRGYRHR